MKLYNVPNNTLVKILPQPMEEEIVGEGGQLELNFSGGISDIKVPVASPELEVDQYIHFGHIDGMYSFCRDMEHNVVHLACWTEVEPVEWTYENMALLRTLMKRGGRGKDGTEELKWVRTDKMSDEWLDNCILYEETYRANNPMIEFYKWEQQYRKEHGITITE